MTRDSRSTDKPRVIGGIEVKVSPEYLGRIRTRARSIKTDEMSWKQVTDVMVAEFTDVSPRTLVDHVRVAAKVSDYLFGLYTSGQMSYLVLVELAGWKTDEDKDALARTEILKHNMTYTQVIRFKKSMSDRRNNLDTARAIALGEVPRAHRREKANRAVKDIKDIVDEIEDLSFKLRSRFELAESIIPGSVLDNGEVKARLFKIVWDLRHASKETFEYVDSKTKKFLEEIKNVNQTESTLAIEAKEGDRDVGKA